MRDHDITELAEVREAALRPLGRSSWRFWAFAAILAALVVWGIVAYVDQLMIGLGVAGYSDKGSWGIYESNLVAFIGVSYGGALVSAILRLTQARWRAPVTRLAEAMALFSLLVGALFAIIHLGRPERIWELVVQANPSSPIVWDFIAVTSYLLGTLIFLYLPLVPDIATLRDRAAVRGGLRAHLYRALAINWRGLPAQRRKLEVAVTAIAIVIIPLAVLVHSVLSWAFAVNSRPGWSSTIFAPYFVVAALYSGVGLVILVTAGFRKGYRLERFIGAQHFRNLAYLMLTLDLLYLYFTFADMLTEGYLMNEEYTPVLTEILVGRYALYFWVWVVGAGLVPLLLVALPVTRTIRGIVVAAALVVVGMWLKRLLIVVPPEAQPLISGSWGTFQLTWVPIAITVAGAAAIPLMLMLFFKFFPILAIHEIEELTAERAPERVPELVTVGYGQFAGTERGLTR